MKYNVVKLILCALVIVSACSKWDNTPQSRPELSYELRGAVVGLNEVPISGAEVTIYYEGSQIGQLKTDSGGMYTMNVDRFGSYPVSAHKDGYTYGGTVALADQDAVTVRNIVLRLLLSLEERTSIDIDTEEVRENGAVLQAVREINVSAGGGSPVRREQQIEVDIPPDTEIMVDNIPLDGAVEIAVTPVGIDAVPPPQSSVQPVGAIMLEPAGARFSKDVSVTLPVDIQLPPGIDLPLYRYTGGVWQQAGTASVDETGLGAVTSVTRFGMIAVAPDVMLTGRTEAMSEDVTDTVPISSSQSTVQVEVEASLEFPSGLPANMSEEFARSLITNRTGQAFDAPRMVTVQLGALQKTTRDDAVLAVAKPEPWTQECVVDIMTRTEDAELVLEIGAGQFMQTYTITYRITSEQVRTRCTRRWTEHNQGSI